MSKMRQDAWTHEDDLLLAETVLRHIREGSTQLNAFEEVGDKLNRTSAACGFRWNAEVRNQYNSAIDLAKRQRKERKRQEAKKQKEQTNQQLYSSVNSITIPTENKHSLIIEESLTLDDVINFLNDLKKDYYYSNESKSTIESLRSENDQLHEEVEKLKKQLAMTDNKLKVVEADYNTFIQIMDRARKMTVLDDQSHLKAPTFKMDKNGNLEQYAQGSD